MGCDLTITEVLLNRASESSGARFIDVVGDRAGSYAQVADAALRIGASLAAIGVRRHDAVAIMADTSFAAITAWLGINTIGAVEVWINSGYRGPVLEHALAIAAVKVIFIAEKHVEALAEVRTRLPFLNAIVVLPDGVSASTDRLIDTSVYDFAEVTSTAPLAEVATLRPADIASIVFTSGTSGPAKGVMMPHGQITHLARESTGSLQLTARDVCYCFHPLYHMAGKFMGVLATMVAGGAVVLDRGFTPNLWLERIRQTKATVTLAHGPMIEMIFAEPETTQDRDHDVRRMMACPLPKRIGPAFQRRFGIEAIGVYGMTEIGAPCWTRAGEPYPAGSSGKFDLIDYDFRVVDPVTDEEVAAGTIGEFVVRPMKPWILMQGYVDMPDKTIESWRNMWFHTGDYGYVDPEGFLFFMDRGSDRIRRRGENIASYDIESVAQTHPLVRECAAVAVPSEFEGDDDVLLCIAFNEDGSLAPETLLGFLAERLPHFMVPRYLRFLGELPRTPTGKIQKAKLRNAVDDALWDRKKAGLSLRQLREQN